MLSSSPTRDRILKAALHAYLQHGLKRTTAEDVAAAAGLTRVTVYRYFPGRAQLLRAAFWRYVDILEAALENLPAQASPDAVLEQIAAAFAALPHDHFPARLHELQRLEPELFAEFNAARRAAVNALFDRLLEQARRQGRLRPGLRPAVLRAYFQSAVVDVLLHPALEDDAVSAAELFAAVKEIFLHGILQE